MAYTLLKRYIFFSRHCQYYSLQELSDISDEGIQSAHQQNLHTIYSARLNPVYFIPNSFSSSAITGISLAAGGCLSALL